MELEREGAEYRVVLPNSNDADPGGLCAKGWSSAKLLNHPDRLLDPLERFSSGFRRIDFNEAYQNIAKSFAAISQRYGPDAIGVYGSGSVSNEVAYSLGKFARVVIKTRFIDYNGRYCMSSAAYALKRSLGMDRGLHFPFEEIRNADLIVLVGSNLAETMPPAIRLVEQAKAKGAEVVVIDPRRTLTASHGTVHIAPSPTTDRHLAAFLSRELIRTGTYDHWFVDSRTEGFPEFSRSVNYATAETTELLTGVPVTKLIRLFQLLSTSKRRYILTGRGVEQQIGGPDTVTAFANVALLLGVFGKHGNGFGTLTGQSNGQGGRELGQKCDQLPGNRSIEDSQARQQISKLWQISETDMPHSGSSASEMLTGATDPPIRALLVIGSNPLLSSPDSRRVARFLNSLEFLVVIDPFLSETAQLAHIVLPTALWAEACGTVTTLDGRVILKPKLVDPPNALPTDLEVLSRLAEAMGATDSLSSSPHEVFEEIATATKGAPADYSGLNYRRLSDTPDIHIPCNENAPDGTRDPFRTRFHTESGRARFIPIQADKTQLTTDRHRPLWLVTGRTLDQYQTGVMTRKLKVSVQEPNSHQALHIHPQTARSIGIAEGEQVCLSSEQASVMVKVTHDAALRPDTVFSAFHWSQVPINELVSPVLDPCSKMPQFKATPVRIEKDGQ
jgi:assimilatory nitrate reductase catalytic subunit